MYLYQKYLFIFIISNLMQLPEYLEKTQITFPSDYHISQESLKAYEAFVMAQFMHPDDIEGERKRITDGLTRGTAEHFHLYFLNLVMKGVSFEEFSEDDKKLWVLSEKRHSNTKEFHQILTWLKVIQPLEKIKEVTPNTLKENTALIKYLIDNYIKPNRKNYIAPDFMLEKISSIPGAPSEKQNHKLKGFKQYQRDKRIKWLQDNKNHKHKHHNDYIGYENDIDWSQIKDAHNVVYGIARQTQELFKITKESFFDQLARYLEDKKSYHYKSESHRIYEKMTINQMKNFEEKVPRVDKDQFEQIYFLKVFADEISWENYQMLTNEEKIERLLNLHSYAKSNMSSESLKATLLHYALKITVKIEQPKLEFFSEYIDLVFKQKAHVDNNYLSGIREDFRNDISNYTTEYICPYYFQKTGLDNISKYKDIVPFHCYHTIKKQLQYQNSNGDLSNLPEDFSTDEFKRMQAKVTLRFSDDNKENFRVEEPVTLKLHVKNVQELSIKIFEFNTQTYYQTTKQPFDTSVNLHGMVPYISMVQTFSQPKSKTQVVMFKFSELKNKKGLFIIEFQGNGLMSRAVVKKGQLSLIYKDSPAGQIAYIIDQDKKICKSDNEQTGIWLKDKFYPSTEKDEGAIFIPYGENGQESTETVIMQHFDFCQLGSFTRKSERYDFRAFFHLNSEQVLVGQKAHILIRPQLKLNKQKVSLSLLKNVKVELVTTEFISNQKTSQMFDLNLSDSEETIISFQVPPNLLQIDVNMKAQVQNISLKQLIDFRASESFNVDNNKDNNNIREMFLNQNMQGYQIHVLGRNGEPQQGKNVQFEIKCHRLDGYQKFKHLTTDKEGKIELGKLEGAYWLQAIEMSEYKKESWNLFSKNKNLWTQYRTIEIIEGQIVEFPFNTTEKLNQHQISFCKHKEGQMLQDMFDRVKVIERNHYSDLRIEGLEIGQYNLSLHLDTTIYYNITVKQGEDWQGAFIITKKGLEDKKETRNLLKIEDISANQDTIKIQLNNFTDKSRVHVTATQFIQNNSSYQWSQMNQISCDIDSKQSFPFTKWQNQFDSEKKIGDEIQYVFDRRKKGNQIGCTLDRPSLLMKKEKVRNTKTNKENLVKGNNFDHKKIQDSQQSVNQIAASPLIESQSSQKNRIKDYQNFLSVSPHQSFNLKPDSNGLVSIKIENVQNYTQLQVLACDFDSVVQRQVTMSDLGIQSGGIPKRDLCNYSEIKENQGVCQQREALYLKQGERAHIEDICSSKMVLIDSVQNGVYQAMKQIITGNSSKFESKLQAMLKWDSKNFEQKCSIYSKEVCHEFNFFLYKRDPQFFEKVVKNFIQNKLEKQFVDWYLLGMYDKILKFSSSIISLENLNPFEICLLIDVCAKNGQYDKTKLIAKMLAKKSGNPFEQEKFDLVLKMQDLDTNPQMKDKIQSMPPSNPPPPPPGMQAFSYGYQIGPPGQPYGMPPPPGMGGPPPPPGMGGPPPPPGGLPAMGAPPPFPGGPPPLRGAKMGGPPPPPGGLQPQMRSMMKSAAPINQRQCQDDQIFCGRKPIINDQMQKQLNMKGFTELETTAEYKETQYFQTDFENNKFIRDYAEHLSKNDGTPFLSSNFIHLKWNYAFLAFASLDFQEGSDHLYQSDGKRGIYVTASKNAILFKKEIKECRVELQKDIMVNHRYQSQIDGTEDDDELLVNHPYECEIVMTNIGSSSKRVNILFQIPNGSLPLKKTRFIDSQEIVLKSYTTQKLVIQFYFPKIGQFDHGPSNVTENDLVTSKSPLKKLSVVEQRTIKQVKTFKDLMLTTPGKDKKKEVILELLKKEDQMGFQMQYIHRWTFEDPKFYLKVLEILNEQFIKDDQIQLQSYSHFHNIFNQEEFVDKRLLILEQMNLSQILEGRGKKLLLKDIKSPLIEDNQHFEREFTHLEYFPIINQRVFQINESKEIQNQELDQTYKKFINMLLHQGSQLSEKLKLQLVYYLQLQDRIKESIKVFQTIDPKKLSSTILYDYMKVYFLFLDEKTQDLDKASEIVRKYENYPIDHLRETFLKVREQLDEIKKAAQFKQTTEILTQQDTEITNEQIRQAEVQTKKRQAVIHSISLDKNQNKIIVEADNVSTITVKFYLIDTEILFSRAPFVQDESRQFSYVKPFQMLETSDKEILVPEDLVCRNMIIEVKAEHHQQFLQFYSSKLKVLVNEKYGELRVSNKESNALLPSVYVKVFCKNSSDPNGLFFKDGFTDIRGKFEYAKSSGAKLNNVQKFSILVTSEEYGSQVIEAANPNIYK